MIIKVLTSVVGERCSYQMNRVYDIPDRLANALLRTGQAIRITPETGMLNPPTERAVMPKVQKRKSKSKRRRKRK